MSAPTSPFPPVRRIVTGHSPSGKSTFVEDKELPVDIFEKDHPENGQFIELFHTTEFPNSNAGDYVSTRAKHLVEAGGSTGRMIEMPPGAVSPFHRTVSIDYVLIHKGEITLYLDNNEKKIVKEGDIVTIRGSIHAWHNHTKDWCRCFMVLFGSKSLEFDGKSFAMEYHPFTPPV